MRDENKTGATAAPRPSGSWIVTRLMGLSVLVVAVASMVMSAHASSAPPGGDRSPMAMFGGSPERVNHAIDRMLDGVKATDAQRSQIKQIATAAATDLKTQRENDRGLREKSLQIFTAPTVDAAAAESLRQQMTAQRDVMSKRVLQAMLDVSNVLTPEQRVTLAQRMSDHRAMHDRMQRNAPAAAPAK